MCITRGNCVHFILISHLFKGMMFYLVTTSWRHEIFRIKLTTSAAVVWSGHRLSTEAASLILTTKNLFCFCLFVSDYCLMFPVKVKLFSRMNTGVFMRKFGQFDAVLFSSCCSQKDITVGGFLLKKRCPGWKCERCRRQRVMEELLCRNWGVFCIMRSE